MSEQDSCNIIIVGASGDLTRRKLIPSLFSLYCNGMLPENFRVFGYARSKMDDAACREMFKENLTCRFLPDDERCQGMAKPLLGSQGTSTAPQD